MTPWSKVLKGCVLATAMGLSLVACQDSSASQGGFVQGDPDSERLVNELVNQHMADHPGDFVGIDGIKTRRIRVDRYGKAHAIVDQTVKGLPVFGGGGIFHFNADGTFESMTDDFVRVVRVDVKPAVSQSAAVDAAVAAHGGWNTLTSTPEADLLVLFHDGKSTLAYRVQLAQLDLADPAKPVVFVDAKSGTIAWEYDSLPHQVLADLDAATFDLHSATDYAAATASTDADAVANEAQQDAHKALAYLAANHGRDSFNDAGGVVNNYVHYGRRYVNAFWDGTRLTYGDGDGRTSGPLVTLDIVSHELGHGVMEHTANLIYANESGALNEANSDILAAATEAFQYGYDTGAVGSKAYLDTYLIGEDCWLKDPDGKGGNPPALRYMQDPAGAGDRDYYADRYTGTTDGGGVHTNSGIANLFFYLLSHGGTHPRGKSLVNVQGLGVELAADIWYEAVAGHMTPWADFADARQATIAAATDYDTANGTSTVLSVEDAWEAVGVTHVPLAFDDLDKTVALGTIPVGKSTTKSIAIDASYSALRIVIEGNTNPDADADMYIKIDGTPVIGGSQNDCVSASSGSQEMCQFTNVKAGTYNVLVEAWQDLPAYPTGDVVGASITVYGVKATTEYSCGDGVDNDGDGATDCDDADCDSSSTCGGTSSPTCTPIGDACTPGDSCCGAAQCRTKGKFTGLCW
jgi:bacillolysin